MKTSFGGTHFSMTQDDWVGKYWIWKEQLKVAIITVDIAVLRSQTLVDTITTCPKYPFKFPVTVPPVTCLAQLKWEKNKSPAYWAVDVRPAHPGKDIWQNAWQQTNSGEFSWVKLTLHWLVGNLTIVVLLFLEFQYPDSRVVWWRWSFGGCVFSFSIHEEFMTHV